MPQNLLHIVNAVWRELSSDTYDDTYHTAIPSIWFQHTLCQSQPIPRNRESPITF
jgi:hypothetical protein